MTKLNLENETPFTHSAQSHIQLYEGTRPAMPEEIMRLRGLAFDAFLELALKRRDRDYEFTAHLDIQRAGEEKQPIGAKTAQLREGQRKSEFRFKIDNQTRDDVIWNIGPHIKFSEEDAFRYAFSSVENPEIAQKLREISGPAEKMLLEIRACRTHFANPIVRHLGIRSPTGMYVPAATEVLKQLEIYRGYGELRDGKVLPRKKAFWEQISESKGEFQAPIPLTDRTYFQLAVGGYHSKYCSNALPSYSYQEIAEFMAKQEEANRGFLELFLRESGNQWTDSIVKNADFFLNGKLSPENINHDNNQQIYPLYNTLQGAAETNARYAEKCSVATVDGCFEMGKRR